MHFHGSTWRFSMLLGVLCAAMACQQPAPNDVAPPAAVPPAAAEGPVDHPEGTILGQTIYVPVYSHIYYRNERRVINLAATLSIRNTDASAPLRVTAVRYYNSEGTLVRRYLEDPRVLAPMASSDYVVEVENTSGGSGANFIVEWEADEFVTAPVVEAVMISTASSQGISFLSVGRVLAEREE
jgi:hypothetical protein